MPTVHMLQTTRLEGEAFEAGTDHEVDDETAARWVKLGIAEKGSAKRKEGELTTHEQAQAAVAEQELEIAAQHGDVAAARRLDAQRAAAASKAPRATAAPKTPETPQVAKAAEEPKAPEAAEEPATTTGESARNTLGR